MEKRDLVLVLALAAGACGTDPSASGVFPAEGLVGRPVHVEISGDATSWGDGATVSFGDGITVGSVTVASPTDVFADITIADTAAAGLRDVTVSSNGSFTLKQAFDIELPVELTFTGNIDQGGFPAFTIKNRDFTSPFDSNTVAIGGPNGTSFQVQNSSEFLITGFVSIDVGATPGPVTVTSDADAYVAGTMAVGARTATALTSGTPVSGMLANANDSQLYSISSTGASQLLHTSFAVSDANANPVAQILGSSGSWSPMPVGSNFAQVSTGQYYLVVFDGGTESGYTYQIDASLDTITSAAEGNDTANDAPGGALPAGPAPAFKQTGGSLSSIDDSDYIAFTVDSGHANKHLHILTNIGTDTSTDTAVDVVGSNGTTSYMVDPVTGDSGAVDEGSDCSIFGCSNGGEDVISNALPAGNYYIVVSAGAGYGTADKNYTLLFWYE